MKRILFLSHPLQVPCVHDNTIAEQRAQIETLNASVATLRADIENRQVSEQARLTERDAARADLETARASLATISGERDAALAELATTQASLVVAQAEVTTLRAQTTSVETRANRILAGFGHRPLSLSDVEDPAGSNAPQGDSVEAVHAQYKAITDSKARAKFYAENKDKMFPKSKKK